MIVLTTSAHLLWFFSSFDNLQTSFAIAQLMKWFRAVLCIENRWHRQQQQIENSSYLHTMGEAPRAL